MRLHGMRARSARIYRRTPGSARFFASVPNRIVGRETTSLDEVWVGDVTYLRSGGRWRYLAVVMDRHSRRVVAWSLGPRRDVALTTLAIDRAVVKRRPRPGLVFHSDRGIEFAAYAFRDRLEALGITQSMKRPSELTDNAFIESFFGSLKADVIHARTFDDDRSLTDAVTTYIRRYNRSRLHSSLGYRSPIDFERQTA